MRLSRVYFCYGSILTSVLWLSVIFIYFSIHESQISSLNDVYAVRGENDISRRWRVISQSKQLNDRNHTLASPDLDGLAIVRSPEDKLLRSDGNAC